MRVSGFSTTNYILIASLICNLVLGWWIYDITKTSEEPNVELLKSQFKVESLKATLNVLAADYDSLSVENNKLSDQIKSKSKERVVIKTVYDKKISDIVNLPIDSSVRYVAKRLSEVNID